MYNTTTTKIELKNLLIAYRTNDYQLFVKEINGTFLENLGNIASYILNAVDFANMNNNSLKYVETVILDSMTLVRMHKKNQKSMNGLKADISFSLEIIKNLFNHNSKDIDFFADSLIELNDMDNMIAEFIDYIGKNQNNIYADVNALAEEFSINTVDIIATMSNQVKEMNLLQNQNLKMLNSIQKIKMNCDKEKNE